MQKRICTTLKQKGEVLNLTLRERLIEDMNNMVDARSYLADSADCWQNKVVYALCGAVYDIIEYILRRMKKDG